MPWREYPPSMRRSSNTSEVTVVRRASVRGNGRPRLVAGVAETVRTGIAKAAAAIDNGGAMDVLNKLIAVSNRGAGA